MKFIFILLLLLSFQSIANMTMDEEVEVADKETVTEIYDYCMSMQDAESIVEKELLKCINEELEAGGFKQFSTLAEVKVVID